MTTTRRTFMATSAMALGFAGYAGYGYALAENVPAPMPYGALPSDRQLRGQRMETISFLHFGVNTFTDREWGNGDEDPSLFNPTNFDPDAIVAALKAGGMKGVILTCKHHDGFCLWPTKTTEHCIRNSSWKNGNGDVVKEISEAAKRHGLKFGVYVSPWDRNNTNYGKPAYIQTYRQQITELLTHYGPVFEIWFDGANGGSGYYGGARETRTIDKHTYYDWPTTWALVRKLQPNVFIESDAGLDGRWVGNESGVAGETCWATFNPVAKKGGPAVPGDVRTDQSSTGTRHGTYWMPAECDVSIRPGWFWHEKENAKVKTPEELISLYFKSVGRGATLLLNVPPNRAGTLSQPDVASLAGFHQRLQAMFQDNLAVKATLDASNTRGNSSRYTTKNLVDGDLNSYWATDNAALTPELTIDFGRAVKFDVIRLREAIQLGQRIDAFELDTWSQNAWTQIAQGTSIGNCRLIPLDQPLEATRLRLRITAPVSIALSDLGIFLAPE
jgi:alpha-L-fucosidase